jgi:cytochrome P450
MVLMKLVAQTSTRYPRGPKGHFIFGSRLDYGRDPIGFTDHCAKEYGDIVYFNGLLFSGFQFNHPDYIEEILVRQCSSFVKDSSLQILKKLLGEGLVTSEGSLWQHQRRLIQPAFHRDRIATYAEMMVTYANRLSSLWQDSEIRDVHQDMMRLTIEIVARTLLGADVLHEADSVGTAMQLIIEYFETRSRSPLLLLLPDWAPTSENLRFHTVTQKMNKVIFNIIQQRRAIGAGKDDLISMLLQAQDEDGRRITDQQLRDEVMTLFVAGHETTANALAWTWYLLSQYPEVEAQ